MDENKRQYKVRMQGRKHVYSANQHLFLIS